MQTDDLREHEHDGAPRRHTTSPSASAHLGATTPSPSRLRATASYALSRPQATAPCGSPVHH
ncbi:hypothetical protein, partial [Streptomyces luteocolor]|uniref:hypothetical protein n=1 Tax=Streptomyces luteocolor TaxID=285500 RepID=UPI001EDB69C2